MLITRRSHRRGLDGPFRSRLFASSPELPLRRYRLCRELLFAAMIHSGILVALILALILFAQTLLVLFQRHGAGANPWLARGTVGLVVLAILLLVRRLVGRVRDVLELRREVRALAREIRDGAGRPDA